MLAAETFELVFRAIHIVFAVAWAGSSFLFTVFIEPAATALGPAGAPFMEEAVGRRKAPEVITVIAAVAVIGGWLLWWNDWQQVGGLSDWVGSSFGLWLTLGGLAATGAFVAGLVGIPPNLKKLGEVVEEIEASGGPPAPEQMARMQAIQGRMRTLGRVDLALLTFAVFAMATARYW